MFGVITYYNTERYRIFITQSIYSICTKKVWFNVASSKRSLHKRYPWVGFIACGHQSTIKCWELLQWFIKKLNFPTYNRSPRAGRLGSCGWRLSVFQPSQVEPRWSGQAIGWSFGERRIVETGGAFRQFVSRRLGTGMTHKIWNGKMSDKQGCIETKLKQRWTGMTDQSEMVNCPINKVAGSYKSQIRGFTRTVSNYFGKFVQYFRIF